MTTSVERLSTALTGQYRLERPLGEGGMATVYLAHDLKHDRKVALKVLRSELAETIGRERFLREIRLAAKLSHPHILPLHDSGDADGSLFYVMPNVEGRSLRERMTAERLTVGEAVRITLQVASALDYAHRHDVLHRDIKPENILLQDGQAMVADFGIGKALSDIGGDALTHVGISVGTPAYMSPEQAVGDAVDGRSDLYSLGCVLYEMLVGEPPFTGPNAQAVIAKRFVQTPVNVAALREGVPRAVAAAVQLALARTPVDRHADAAAFIVALQAVEPAEESPRVATPAQSIAVIPFENLSADPDYEFFGDGIAEDIINALTRIEGLRVAARASAFSFKGQHDALAVIGEKLHVATVLQGSVRKAGNRLRITVQLVSVADGYHVWSERYDRDLTDVFIVQDEIAGAIAARLQLTFEQPAANAPRPTSAQVEAYELTLRGRALYAKRGPAILAARQCFEQAIALDPGNAAAHAGLGGVLMFTALYGFGTVSATVPLARAAIARALELDPALASAIATSAGIRLIFDHDPASAFDLWERALALAPQLSEIRVNYAWVLVIVRGDKDRGLAEFARAVADDPLSAFCAAWRACGLSFIGRHDEAKAEALRACALDPQSFLATAYAIWVHTWAGDVDGALALADGAMQSFGRHPWILQVLPELYLKRGDVRRAEAIFTELKARAETSWVPPHSLALAALALGRVDEGVEYALRSVEQGDGIPTMWVREPFAKGLLGHPRHQEILRAMGL